MTKNWLPVFPLVFVPHHQYAGTNARYFCINHFPRYSYIYRVVWQRLTPIPIVPLAVGVIDPVSCQPGTLPMLLTLRWTEFPSIATRAGWVSKLPSIFLENRIHTAPERSDREKRAMSGAPAPGRIS